MPPVASISGYFARVGPVSTSSLRRDLGDVEGYAGKILFVGAAGHADERPGVAGTRKRVLGIALFGVREAVWVGIHREDGERSEP